MASASRWSAAGLWVRVENNRLSVSVTVRRMAWVKSLPQVKLLKPQAGHGGASRCQKHSRHLATLLRLGHRRAITRTEPPMDQPRRRSLHFVPGGQSRMFEKALSLDADTLILDLEDAVTPDRKAEARQEVLGWLEALADRPQERMVRQPASDPWGRRTSKPWCWPPYPHSLLVPKVSSTEDVIASFSAWRI